LLVGLRLLDLLPKNGDPRLFAILIGMAIFGVAVAVVQGIMGASLLADILDDHELNTGFRQEGMFNAAISFSGKATSSVGIIMGGLILKAINLPPGAVPANVAPEVITRLGLLVGLCVPLLHIIPISLITRYKLTREAHAEVRRGLDQRNADRIAAQ
jgi:Na+/melibiose symporter-like transporter